jgi:hypothetical protein
MAVWWVRIDLLQNYFAIRNVCLRRWQIILTGFSAESQSHQSSLNNFRPVARVRLYFMTFWTHRAAASFSRHSACLCRGFNLKLAV